MDVTFGCLATMIGSLPHKDPEAACRLVGRCLKELPAWPQLPRRSPRENMYVQYSQGFPGLVLTDGSIYVDQFSHFQAPLERLYTAYLANDFTGYPVTAEYAAGLHTLPDILRGQVVRGAKGQITGPVTWGLTVTDKNKRPVLYDDVLGDAAARFLRLKAAWLENELRQISPRTVLFIDEPYMSAYGSVSTGALSKEKVTALLEEVFGGLKGAKGVHCCGNTDWPVLLGTSTDIISFDAYNYGQSLSLYPAEVKKFLARPGAIAWGIVPNDAEAVGKESVASLKDRLEEVMAPFTRDGISFRQLLAQSLVTPCCGLASLSEEGAARVLELTADLSAEMRRRYL